MGRLDRKTAVITGGASGVGAPRYPMLLTLLH
jgi:hypothetical protein